MLGQVKNEEKNSCYIFMLLIKVQRLNHTTWNHNDLGQHSPQPLGQQRTEDSHPLQYSTILTVEDTEDTSIHMFFVHSFQLDHMSITGLSHFERSLRQLQLQRVASHIWFGQGSASEIQVLARQTSDQFIY